MVMYEAYRRGFVYGDLGVAAALATCLLLVVLAIVALQLYLLRPKD
jgi:multiple sugar transport system permease protein